MSNLPDVPTRMLGQALETALDALSGDQAVSRVAKYYATESNFAGALFLGLADTDPDAITAADLFAVSTLSVQIPARGARRLLLEAGGAASVNEALRELPTTTLAEADDADLLAMEAFYLAIKASLKRADARGLSGAWVTASKIAARKRPSLFPVRDTEVTTLLGTREQKDYFTDWLVYRRAMRG